ncbi:MAG: hypothetical protein Q9213_008034, partial [Squamulea squamosa]
MLDDAARQANEKKKQNRRSKKPQIDLASVAIYDVIPEALAKPEKKQPRRTQSNADPVASSSKVPARKRERDDTHQDDTLASAYGQGTQQQPYVLAGEAPPQKKKPRHSQAAASSTNVQNNHNNDNAASDVLAQPSKTSRSRK